VWQGEKRGKRDRPYFLSSGLLFYQRKRCFWSQNAEEMTALVDQERS